VQRGEREAGECAAGWLVLGVARWSSGTALHDGALAIRMTVTELVFGMGCWYGRASVDGRKWRMIRARGYAS